MTCPCKNDPFDEWSEATPTLDHLVQAAQQRPELASFAAEDPADYWALSDDRWILVYGRDSGAMAVLLKEGPVDTQVIGIVRVDTAQDTNQAVTEVLFQLD